MNMGMMYQWMYKMLRNMDEKQLLELFADLDDIKAVQRIADCAYHFTENYDYATQEDYDRVNGKSDTQDLKDQDNAQRYRDIKSQEGGLE